MMLGGGRNRSELKKSKRRHQSTPGEGIITTSQQSTTRVSVTAAVLGHSLWEIPKAAAGVELVIARGMLAYGVGQDPASRMGVEVGTIPLLLPRASRIRMGAAIGEIQELPSRKIVQVGSGVFHSRNLKAPRRGAQTPPHRKIQFGRVKAR